MPARRKGRLTRTMAAALEGQEEQRKITTRDLWRARKEEDVEESGGKESQESGSEEVLKRSWKRSKTGHARDPDHDTDRVEARIPKDILNEIMPD